MFNAPSNALLIAGLALGLNACGGGDGGGGEASSTAQPAAESRLMAITVPHWTVFPIDISRNPDGTEILNIPDPTLGMQKVAIRSRDGQGNITALEDKGPFSAAIGLLNNRIGMLCGSDTHFKKGSPGQGGNQGHYVYLSTDFKEVNYQESFGRKFRVYQDCRDDGLVSIDAKGTLRDVNDPTAEPQEKIVEIFTPGGYKDGTGTSAVIVRVKAYRYTANGKDIYALVGVVSVNPDVPQSKATEQAVSLAISE